MRVVRSLAVVLILAVQGAFAQKDTLDPSFAKVPFDEWMNGAGQSQMKWTATVPSVVLSNHQRLLQQVSVTLDGAEVSRRRGTGQLVLFFQITDAGQHKYQDHSVIDLAKMEEGIKGSDIVFGEGAFLLPGDYLLSLAIYCTSTQEHAVRKEKVHVARRRGDPLPDAWNGLPTVEIRPAEQPPDQWFQPAIRSKLNLQVETPRPTKLDVLLNLTPSERATGSQQAQDLGLAVMLPAMKVLANVDWRNASIRITLLDLLRQKIPFDQDKVREVDWPGMRQSLGEVQPGQIDVKSLGERQHQASFFVTQVGKRLGPGKAVIVLSSMVAFESGQDLEPIHGALPEDCRLYYVRFHQQTGQLVAQVPPYQGRRPPPRSIGMPQGRTAPPKVLTDQLEATLKPLNPRLYDVESPEQFRAALASILEDLRRTK